MKKLLITSLVIASSTFATDTKAPVWKQAMNQIQYTGEQIQLAGEQVAPYLDREMLMQLLEQIDWQGLGSSIETALGQYDFADAAALRPYGEQAFNLLDRIPVARPYSDWLRQRLDYLVVAEMIQKAPPPARKNSTKKPHKKKTGIIASSPGAAHRIPNRPKEQRISPATRKSPDIKRWEKALAKRPQPASAKALVPKLKKIFTEEGVPEKWVWLAEVESSFNPKARSPVGAVGLFQFMPATAKRFNLQTSPTDERLDPLKSARAAAQYLAILHRRFNDWPLALAAYNAGEGRVGRCLKKHNGKTFEDIAPHLPVETRLYVPKVQAVAKLRQ